MDIILLIFLCSKIAGLAEQKNVSKAAWILRTILNWILGEVFGIFLSASILMSAGRLDPETIQVFGEMNQEMLLILCAGLLGGYLGYLLTRRNIEKLPDVNGNGTIE